MSSISEMVVTKRDGSVEVVSFDKILKRIKTMGEKEPCLKGINYTELAIKVIEQLCNKITTSKIDELTAEQCHAMYSIHPDYNVLAGRMIISKHHKNTSESFTQVMNSLYEFVDKNGKQVCLVNDTIKKMVDTYGSLFDSWCDYSRDYLLDYFGFKTLERAYLKAINKVVVERPQHMWLRVAIGIHCTNMDLSLMEGKKGVLERVKETYELMSQKYFTHATPTLYNAGTNIQQLSSCYLLAMESDSLDGIFNTLKECAMISKGGGGIGLHIHNVRATGSHIRGTDGYSNGIVPMLRVFNNTARYVDQCVLPSTILYTTQGPKQIQHCVKGETAIFGKGGGHEVIQDVLEHDYDGDVLEIDTLHSLGPLKITPQHPVYALRNQAKGVNDSMIQNRVKKEISGYEWIEAGELEEEDKIVFSIPSYEKDFPEISADDCYLYGILLGYGSMSNDAEASGYISLPTVNKKKVLEFVQNYFDQRLVKYFVVVNENTTRIRWSRTVHLPFRYNDFYNEQKEKYVHYRWLNLPLSKSQMIIKGLLDTDGCKETKEFVIDNTSLHLIEACRYLCLRMGILTSGYIRDRIDEKHLTSSGRVIENKNLSYSLHIPKTQAICDLIGMEYSDEPFFKFQRIDNHLLTHIQGIRKVPYKGVLYDLQMRNEHNYLLSHGLVHNGGGKRKGSFSIYLEPWHADVEMFLAMKRNQGNEELKARDLFYALWIPDLFMQRVKENGNWTLFCPDECPGLSNCYGNEFKETYERYEKDGKGKKTMKAQELWLQIVDTQMETGNPYLLYKDSCNAKSNQQNLGVIKSSNLCTEIIQYSDANETAVCNLASIALPSFVMCNGNGGVQFDFQKLRKVSRVVTYNLNRIIDINAYPSEKANTSNMRHRPIGIGIQGLADVFMMMNLAFCSDASKELNRQIFETIYLGAVEESIHLSEMNGPYSSFTGSPASRGCFQFHLWDGKTDLMYSKDWERLKERVQTVGMRNSLLVAPMPTASTSQILGFNECFEPITSNFYMRKTLAGNFIVANRYLVKDLLYLGVWNEKVKNSIIANNGSIQHLDLSKFANGNHIKEKYLTVWEMKMKHLIDMAADRGRFICQSQSLNLWQEKPTRAALTSMHFYGWSKGLKTGLYYLHTLAKAQTQQFSIEPTLEEPKDSGEGGCEMCSA